MKYHIVSLLAATCALLFPQFGVAKQTTASSNKPHLVIVIAESEYRTDQTLPLFAKANLENDFRTTILHANKEDRNDIPGIDAVKEADIVFLSIRRRTLPPSQLEVIRNYVASGKPLVGIRTTCHAFCLRKEAPPAGLADWPEFDAQIIGGNYSNHYGNKLQAYVQVNERKTNHPILKGIRKDEFPVFGSLYRCGPLADSTTLLMTGRVEAQPREPVAWTNRPKSGNRVFFTSLGHPQDFKLPAFVRLLRNGVFWAAGIDIPASPAVTIANPPEK